MTVVLLEQQTDFAEAPNWVRDQIDSSRWNTEAMNSQRLYEELPGLQDCFDELIGTLPNADGNATGEFPIAAGVVVQDEGGRLRFLSKSLNKVKSYRDSTAHAEMVAMREAQDIIGSEHLDGAYLLSTCEPCAMCCGAIEHTQLSGVVFAASQADMRGKYMKINGIYKPFRASPEEFSAIEYLTKAAPELLIVSGLSRQATLRQLQRTNGTMAEYYRDPDDK